MIAFHVGTLIFLFVEIVCCKYKLGSTMDVILLLCKCFTSKNKCYFFRE